MPAIARYNVSNNVSAFSPYCKAAGIPLVDDEPVNHGGCLYFEIVGTSLWLVQSLTEGGAFFVSDSDGIALSAKFWSPCYAVERFLQLRKSEEDGLI
jgi:hypothetical protein